MQGCVIVICWMLAVLTHGMRPGEKQRKWWVGVSTLELHDTVSISTTNWLWELIIDVLEMKKKGLCGFFYGKVQSIYMFYCFFLASWSVAWYWVLSKFGWWLILFSFWVLNKLAHSSFILKCSWRWELSFQWMLRIRDDWNSWSPSGQRTFQHYSGLKYDLARSRKPLASLNSFCFSFIVASSSCQESFWVAVEVKIMVLGVSYFADSVLWENISLFLQN